MAENAYFSGPETVFASTPPDGLRFLQHGDSEYAAMAGRPDT